MASDAYTKEELDEIERFLAGAYITASSRIANARPRSPAKATAPEVERLKRKQRDEAPHFGISDTDVNDLSDAVEGPFASDLRAEKAKAAEHLITEQADAASGQIHPVSLLVLQSISKRVCAAGNVPTSAGFAIKSATLASLLAVLHLDPLFAPAVVWTATRIRDLGIPVFCDTLRAYLEEHGLK